MNGVLNIYKASAGSGKTYTLTEQYIKMLLDARSHGKDYFRRVLAVTFTNKATDEMKSRIVKKLYEVSAAGETVTVADVELKPERARELLTSILHNYSFFRITTIDKFFQQIIRSFVKEIGLSGNYSIELDEKRIIKDTIADILLKIGDKDHKLFLTWFSEHIIADSDEGESKDFNSLKSKLEDISSQIFKEQYMAIKGSIPDSTAISAVQRDLAARRKEIWETLRQKADSIMQQLQSEPDVADNCKRGAFTPVISFLAEKKVKYPEFKAVFLKWADEAQVSKSNKYKALVEDAYNRWIRSKVVDFIDYANAKECEFRTCDVVLRNLPFLKLFSALDCEIERYMKESGTQLLSKSGALINEIIDGSDTPFIYEKTGTYINHFLIDEFQDTSRLQWDNFVPLIKNSLSEGDNNLVVGDVKQSIYRFRDSDWSILGKDVQKKFNGCYVVHNLETNYRSLPEVVKFNNSVFTATATFLQNSYNALSGRSDDTILNAYSDVKQGIKREGSGYVEINFQDSDDEENSRYDLVLAKIGQLLEYGYSLKDIGVLVKTNREGSAIAKHLLENGINVVSEEALRISSNQAVADIVAVLRYMANPMDEANSYLVNNIINVNGRLDLAQLGHLPLYEIVEQIIFMLGLDQLSTNTPYLNAFKDLVTDFIGKQSSVIQSFLEYWDEVKDNKSLTTISESDSVNIITIHKSKGLSYKVVIIPEINWDLRNSNHAPILWEQMPGSIYVPLQYKAELAKTIFKERYFDELLLEYIDNLNDLYVAFTRAEDVLIGYCSTPRSDPFKESDSKPFSSMLPLFYAGTGRDVSVTDYSQIVLGELTELKKEADTDGSADGDARPASADELSPVEKMRTFHLRGLDIITPEIEAGSRMHRIMESVVTITDLDGVLKDMLYKGYIDQQQYDEMKSGLTTYITNPQAQKWFDGSQRVLAERSIVNVYQNASGEPQKQVLRPDRVMIDSDTNAVTIVDYKFGDEKTKEHIAQVQRYVNLYKKAGYAKVTGYLYYFEGLEIIKV